MKEMNLPVLPGYEVQGDFTVISGQNRITELLKHMQPSSAVFVCNDRMAIGAVNAALEMGYRIPTDIAIVGFDNIPEAELIRPKLTTVAQFPVEMGRQLANALFERIEGGVTGPRRNFEIPLQLIVRQSA